jgi:septal ring factor EnvC (AmiA/AmiB activator)
LAGHYKDEIDPDGIAQFGLVAEDVEKVNPDLVDRGADGKLYSVRYEAVNAMLLNEFLKEHRKNEEQGATITQQRKDFEAAIAQQQREIEALTATVKEQAAQIQKVSADLGVSKTAPQIVLNNH